jgi:hypothetical protein
LKEAITGKLNALQKKQQKEKEKAEKNREEAKTK